MNDKLKQLCEPFPGSQITTRKTRGHQESWVEQHHLIDRLNSVLGFAGWSWEIIELKQKPVKIGRSGKDGQHAQVHGRLTLHLDRDIVRDGLGEAAMLGVADAAKGANSVAFRHAAKCFTTFLWGGGFTQEEPEPVDDVVLVADYGTAPPAAPAPAQQKQHQPAAQGSSDWGAKLPDEWADCMGKIADKTSYERAAFESHLYCALGSFKGDNGWVLVTNNYPTFKDLAAQKEKWALRVKKSADDVAAQLDRGESVTIEIPQADGSVRKMTMQSKANQSVSAPAPESAEVIDDVPF